MKKFCSSLVPIFLLTLFTANILRGQDPRINQTFLPKVTGFPEITQSLIMPDGKVIVVGRIRTVEHLPVNKIARINLDGSLDKSFEPPLFPNDLVILSIILDGNNKIMVGGHVNEQPYCVRLNIDGSLDTSFTLSPLITSQVIRAYLLPGNSYLLLTSGLEYFVKVKNDGSLDQSFNSGNPNSFNFLRHAIAVQPDGKILIGSTFTEFGGQPAPGIVRLHPTGAIDNTFSIGSGPYHDNGYPSVKSIALHADKIIVVGSFTAFNSTVVKNLVVLGANGNVDTNFIYPGPASNIFTESLGSVVVHSNGLVLGGSAVNNNEFEYRFMKLKFDGSLDTDFNQSAFEGTEHVSAFHDPLVSTNETSILVSGNFGRVGSIEFSGVAKINTNGIVSDFNPAIGGEATILEAKVQDDGKLIIGGAFTHVNGVRANNLARLNVDGSLDVPFAQALGSGFDRKVNAIAIQSDGKILVGGAFSNFNQIPKSILIRLNEAGSIDNSFQTDLMGASSGVGVNAIVQLPDGLILVGGSIYNFSGNYSLVKLGSDGAIDQSFQFQGSMQDNINDIAIQSDGHVIIGGFNFPNGLLKRINFDGAIASEITGTTLENFVVSVVKVLPNDDFLIGGALTSSHGDDTPNPLMQFSQLGVLKDQISVAVYGGSLTGIEATEDGFIYLTGQFKKVNGILRKGVAKAKLNGTVDPAFDIPFGSSDFYISKLVRKNAPYKEFFALGRYNSLGSLVTFGMTKFIDPIQAQIHIDSESLNQVYNQEPKQISISTTPLGLSTSIEYKKNESIVTNPVGAGQYQAIVMVDDPYYHGNQIATLSILKATATIQVNSDDLTQVYNSQPKAIRITTSPVGFNVGISYSKNGAILAQAIDGGIYEVSFEILDSNYQGTNSATLTVTKASQTISFAPISDKILGGPAFALNSSASSNLPVSFESTTNKVTISGNMATLVNAGRTGIKAYQPGNDNYQESEPITLSFCIKPAKPSITGNFSNVEEPILISSNSGLNNWYLNDSPLQETNNGQLSITGIGTYKVESRADDCISELSDGYVIVVTGDTQQADFSAYPNPTSDYYIVRGVSSDASGKVYALNNASQSVTPENLNGVLIFDVRGLPEGVYVATIMDLGRLRNMKFIVK